MGGEGSMMSANNSLKNNRSLLSKRKEKNSLSGSYSNVELADFPESTPEQLERIKAKLQQEQKQIRKKQVILFSLTMIALFFVFVYF